MTHPEKNGEFEEHMSQLMQILKSLLKNLPHQGAFPGANFPGLDPEKNNVHLNICIFAFLPISPEEYEEYEDLHDQAAQAEEGESGAHPQEWTPSDLEFLRRHGIRF